MNLGRRSPDGVNRRSFVALAAAFNGRTAQADTTPIIDTHMHLFDTRRPRGVPWPEKKDTLLYQPSLPDRYRSDHGAAWHQGVHRGGGEPIA